MPPTPALQHSTANAGSSWGRIGATGVGWYDHGTARWCVRACREELLEIGRKPGLSTLPQGVNMSVIRCVLGASMTRIPPASTARASPARCSSTADGGAADGGGLVVPKLTTPYLGCCRELDELTFFDSGPKPDWSKEKSPGYGRLDFLRPGEHTALGGLPLPHASDLSPGSACTCSLSYDVGFQCPINALNPLLLLCHAAHPVPVPVAIAAVPRHTQVAALAAPSAAGS